MAGNKKKSTSSKKKKGGRRDVKVASRTPTSPPDVNEVISQADQALESSNLENALQLYNYAAGVLRNKLQELTNNTAASNEGRDSNVLLLSKVLGKMAEAKVSIGDQHGGQQDFLEATNLLSGDGPLDNPIARAQWREARASLYLYLGQLSTSNDALEAFTRAISDLQDCVNLLEEGLKTNSNDENLQQALVETNEMVENLRRQMCGAYCSVAELYLTDLCFEPNAEQNCESALKLALELDDPQSSPDALQAMANLRLSQNKGLEAVTYILEAYNRVKVGCEAMADLVGLGVDNDMQCESEGTAAAKELKGEALDAANSLPGFEFRCQMGKILLECASIFEDTSSDAAKKIEQRKICIEAGIQVMGSLLAENDEVIEIWFLLGCAFSSADPKNVDASKHYFENALEMLSKVKKGLKREVPNEEIRAEIKDVDQKIRDVKQRLEDVVNANTGMDES